MLFDAAGVECAMESFGVAVVFGEGGGETVCAIHFVAGAEVYIGGLGGVEDGIDRGGGGETDGSWRQACVKVGVEGGLYVEVLVEDSLEGEVADGIFHGGVGLEEHALFQTVEVDAGNEGLLFVVVGFFFDDGCQDDDVFE